MIPKHILSQTDKDSAARTFGSIQANNGNVRQCARCGGNHEGLKWIAFTQAFYIGTFYVLGWTTCPTLEEPILWGALKDVVERDI